MQTDQPRLLKTSMLETRFRGYCELAREMRSHDFQRPRQPALHTENRNRNNRTTTNDEDQVPQITRDTGF